MIKSMIYPPVIDGVGTVRPENINLCVLKRLPVVPNNHPSVTHTCHVLWAHVCVYSNRDWIVFVIVSKR